MAAYKKAYTLHEQRAIIKFIRKYQYYDCFNGTLMWHNMEVELKNKGIVRTWQSLKNHFLKTIRPNINNKQFKLGELEIRKFQFGQIGWTAMPSSDSSDCDKNSPGARGISDTNFSKKIHQKNTGHTRNEKLKMSGYRPLYSFFEQNAIIEYISKNEEYRAVKGVIMWRAMEVEFANMGINRTWQSLKNHFIKTILPNINARKYKLQPSEIKNFKSGSVPEKIISSESSDENTGPIKSTKKSTIFIENDSDSNELPPIPASNNYIESSSSKKRTNTINVLENIVLAPNIENINTGIEACSIVQPDNTTEKVLDTNENADIPKERPKTRWLERPVLVAHKKKQQKNLQRQVLLKTVNEKSSITEKCTTSNVGDLTEKCTTNDVPKCTSSDVQKLTKKFTTSNEGKVTETCTTNDVPKLTEKCTSSVAQKLTKKCTTSDVQSIKCTTSDVQSLTEKSTNSDVQRCEVVEESERPIAHKINETHLHPVTNTSMNNLPGDDYVAIDVPIHIHNVLKRIGREIEISVRPLCRTVATQYSAKDCL